VTWENGQRAVEDGEGTQRTGDSEWLMGRAIKGLRSFCVVFYLLSESNITGITRGNKVRVWLCDGNLPAEGHSKGPMRISTRVPCQTILFVLEETR